MTEFRIKEKTKSLNQSFRGDWRARASVAKRQRNKAMSACPKWIGGPLLVVRITRISPGTLDNDSVPAACKHIRDGIAGRLKVDDASPLVQWEYAQAKGEAEVVVQIWRAGEEAPPVPMGSPVARKRDVALPNGMRLRSPPRTGAKAGDPRYVEAYIPPRSKPMDAAKEAEETFAPSHIPPCAHCGEQYDPKCYDRNAPTNSVSCRKYVHCTRYDGHKGECRTTGPRCCTT